MEAAAEGAVGLSEAGDGSPLSGAAASDDADTVVGVSYGMDAADMGTLSLFIETPLCDCLAFVTIILTCCSCCEAESPDSSLLAKDW